MRSGNSRGSHSVRRASQAMGGGPFEFVPTTRGWRCQREKISFQESRRPQELLEIAEEFLNNTSCLRRRSHTTSNQIYYALGAAFPSRYRTHPFRLVQFRVVHDLGLSIENTRRLRYKWMFSFVQDNSLVLPRLERSDVYDQHVVLGIWVGNDYPEVLFFTLCRAGGTEKGIAGFHLARCS